MCFILGGSDCLTRDNTNYKLTDIVTPVKADLLGKMLRLANYDTNETDYLVQGFSNGFSLEYEGTFDRSDYSENIPLRDIGTPRDLWEKMMKEIRLKHFAGPYKSVPYNNFVQSPIGLVPKAGGQTHLIFHLSYEFKGWGSIIGAIPKEKCTVKYRDLHYSVRQCLKLLKNNPGAKL